MFSIRRIYARDIHVIRVLFIVILFWLSVSHLADTCIQHIHKKTDIPLWKIHLALVIGLIGVILIDPYTIEKV